MNIGSRALNINLIIPFKDNKGKRLELYKLEMDRFKEELCCRAESLKGELLEWFGDTFELTIAARSDGYTKKFYWRFKSSSRDRKFSRLDYEPISQYLRDLQSPHVLRLKDIEEELIYINANLKVIKGLNDAMSQCSEEQEKLLGLNI